MIRPVTIALALVALHGAASSGAAEEKTSASAGPAAVAGQLPLQARLLLPACAVLPFDRQALAEILEVELLTNAVRLGGSDEAGSVSSGQATAGVALIAVDAERCGAEVERVTVRLSNPRNERSVASPIELQRTVEPARTRILALAIAELLRSSWPALELGPALALGEQPAAPPPVLPLPPASPSNDCAAVAQTQIAAWYGEQRRTELSGLDKALDIALTANSHPTTRGGLLGVLLGGSFPLSNASLRLATDVGAGTGVASDELGDVHLVAVELGLAAALATRRRALPAAIGPRLGLGWAWATGKPLSDAADGNEVSTLTVTLGLSGQLRLRLDQRWLLLFGTDLGYTLHGLAATAGDRPITALAGPFMGLRLGVSRER